jgi:hypothetical protein
MNNPFVSPDFQFEPDHIKLGVNQRTGSDLAVVQNAVDGTYLLFERVSQDGTSEGFTWWCVGASDETGACTEPYDPAPLVSDAPQIKAIEDYFQSCPDEIREQFRHMLGPSGQN